VSPSIPWPTTISFSSLASLFVAPAVVGLAHTERAFGDATALVPLDKAVLAVFVPQGKNVLNDPVPKAIHCLFPSIFKVLRGQAGNRTHLIVYLVRL